MSRCFPFPPPGYERKARTDDADLLKKEKDGEKKHKKEKKDKEKRDSKEKKEKDRSDGKHKDKKEKKEKHRDKREKNKDKDKEKDRDKSSVSDEKRFSAHSDQNSGEKASKERKLFGKSEGNGGDISSQKGKEKELQRNSITGEKKLPGQFSDYNGEKLGQISHLAEHPKDSKLDLEMARKVANADRGTGNQLVEKPMGIHAKRDDGMVMLVAKVSSTLAEARDKNKKGDDRKFDGQGIRDEARFTGSVVAQSQPGMVQTRVEGMPRPLEKVSANRVEAKDNTKQKEGDDKRRDKQKDKDKEKKHGSKDKERDKEKKKEDKEKKKEEKAKEKSEWKNADPDKLKEITKLDFVGVHNVKPSHPQKEGTKTSVAEGTLGKRKDLDTNGFLNANDIKPSKLLRPTSSPLPLRENGRTLESCHVSSPVISAKQEPVNCHASGPVASAKWEPVNNFKVENKARKINGMIDAQVSSISSMSQPSSTNTLTSTEVDITTEVCQRPPHPDSKYLSEVLTVPKMEELSDSDNQEWLLQNSGSQSKKPKVGSSANDELPQVWSEALPIDSADIWALPYVIPY